jgi:hypothetical protein
MLQFRHRKRWVLNAKLSRLRQMLSMFPDDCPAARHVRFLQEQIGQKLDALAK